MHILQPIRPLLFLLLCLLFCWRVGPAASQIISHHDTECQWRKNITDIEEVAHHRYAILEECLFYKLSQQADQEQGKGSALMLLPPTQTADEKLNVEVLSVVVRQMWMNEVWKEMHVNGYMAVTWKDRRLKWDMSDWKADKLAIKSYGRLWVPDINSAKHQTSMQASDYTTYQNIEVSNTGNVTARLEYRMQAECEIDFSSYPDDKKYCCFTLKSQLYPRYITYFLVQGEQGIDYRAMRTNWNIEDATLKIVQDAEDRKTPALRLCLRSSRQSSTLRIELTIPMIISAVLVLVAPLFGNFQQQLYVKLFAILLQFLCFQYLVNKTPQIGFGNEVPSIYRFYEFTVAATLFSLLVTLVIAAFSRIERKLPPPHRLTLLASALNANMCCAGEGDGPSNAKSPDTTYQCDWMQIHSAVNNLLSLLVVLVYVIGVVVIIV